jgi:hypothetical protein
MDYDEHELHELIQETWSKNRVPNIVLSSATLPKFHNIPNVIQDFKNKFNYTEEDKPSPSIFNILSHECSKTIPIFDNNGFIVIPHFYSNDYRQVLKVADHCSNNLTILRYLDLGEIVSFILKIIHIERDSNSLSVFERIGILDISQLTMENIKKGYLELLQNIDPDMWDTIYNSLLIERKCHMTSSNSFGTSANIKKSYSVCSPSTSNLPLCVGSGGSDLRRLKSLQEPITSTQTIQNNTNKAGTYGIYLTTSDAHTLTEGPTIFLANDVEKVAQFCLQQANIPSLVMDELMKKIEKNNILSEKIMVLEKELEDAQDSMSSSSISKNKSKTKSKSKGDRENTETKEEKGVCRKLQSDLDSLRMQVKPVNLNEVFIPNSMLHLNKWASHVNLSSSGIPFTSRIEDSTIVEIMSLHEIDDSWKILLLMGIGIFTTHKNPKYLEIVKQLATEQHLYLIIASSDYIYGTNYQFCHGYLSKDLELTQEKIIQSIGRIGRNNIQQTYSIRFRDNCFIEKLFTNQGITPEITNMNRLFVTLEE